MNTQSGNIPRRYDLDWLRVWAILAIFFFHTTRLFDPDGWLLKNSTTYVFVDMWKEFATSWGMPLILIISGASAFYALGKYHPGKYARGLLARLLLPLLVGIFTHVAFQIYLENLHKGQFDGSFFQFYPHYFDGMYGFGGNFAWMGSHLWYLEILFILSFLCLPLFAWFKYSQSGQTMLKDLGNQLAKPGRVFLFSLPVILLIETLDPTTWGIRELGGWSVFIYPCFFIAGFIIFSHAGIQDRIQRTRWFSLLSGIFLSGSYLFLEFQTGHPALMPLSGKWNDLLFALSCWSWLLAVCGFGMKHLNFSTPFLKYANEAALPFYILHQTVLLSLAYFVVQWDIPDILKWVTILIFTLAISVGLYEFLIRRLNLLRLLFGMKLAIKPVNAPINEISTIKISSINQE